MAVACQTKTVGDVIARYAVRGVATSYWTITLVDKRVGNDL